MPMEKGTRLCSSRCFLTNVGTNGTPGTILITSIAGSRIIVLSGSFVGDGSDLTGISTHSILTILEVI